MATPVWAPTALRLLKEVARKAATAVRSHLGQAPRQLELQPALARNRQPISRLAAIRQRTQQRRPFSSYAASRATVSRFLGRQRPLQVAYLTRASLPQSTIATTISRFSHRSPFSTALRPNLTGGALPRSAGGYGLGGRVRYFCHSPAPAAEVLSNVSSAVRAFWLQGNRAGFDGFTSAGEKRYRHIRPQEAGTKEQVKAAGRLSPGAYVDFDTTPLFSALTPCNFTNSLNTPGLIDVLESDFTRTQTDLAATLKSIRALASLGDLAITTPTASTIRVHFPGCDAQAVERLCTELCLLRGTVGEDAAFAEDVGASPALRFPFASTQDSLHRGASEGWDDMSGSAYGSAKRILALQTPDGYETLSELASLASRSEADMRPPLQDFEGLEGIHLFLQQCDAARRVL